MRKALQGVLINPNTTWLKKLHACSLSTSRYNMFFERVSHYGTVGFQFNILNVRRLERLKKSLLSGYRFDCLSCAAYIFGKSIVKVRFPIRDR